MSEFNFGPEELTTIGELRVGDFIVVVPTQERVRGIKFDSGVKSIEPYSGQAARYKVKHPSMVVVTHRTAQGYIFPNHFTVRVRRLIPS